MSLDVIRELPLKHWRPDSKDLPEGSAENWLESGKVLFFPRLRFDLSDAETRFVAESWANGKAKNISYRGHQEPLRGAQGNDEDLEQLRAMIARFAHDKWFESVAVGARGVKTSSPGSLGFMGSIQVRVRQKWI